MPLLRQPNMGSGQEKYDEARSVSELYSENYSLLLNSIQDHSTHIASRLKLKNKIRLEAV